MVPCSLPFVQFVTNIARQASRSPEGAEKEAGNRAVNFATRMHEDYRGWHHYRRAGSSPRDGWQDG
jgi:hypothetical protein